MNEPHPAIEAIRKRVMKRNAERIEQQARIFVKMGYELDELVLVMTKRGAFWSQENVVPKSALRERQEEE